MKRNDYNNIKKDIEEMGYQLISQEYKSNSSKLIVKDKNGYYYYVPYTTLVGQYSPSIVNKSNPYTTENIGLWLKLNNRPVTLVSAIYVNYKNKMIWNCHNCGQNFKMSWNSIQTGTNCPVCDGRQVTLSNCLATVDPELSKEWHPTLNGDLTPYTITAGSKKKVWWQCSNGHEWQKIVDERKRLNCPYCSGYYPTEDSNLLKNNPILCEEWDYIKNEKSPENYTPYSSEIVWWRCKKCGHSWKNSINNRNGRYNGCPRCAESRGERKIREVLKSQGIKFIPQFSFPDLKDKALLRFDFSVLDKKDLLILLIEYDGIGHYDKNAFGEKSYRSTIKHDKMKDTYCHKNNINLLRIPYWNFTEIEEILVNTFKSLLENNVMGGKLVC